MALHPPHWPITCRPSRPVWPFMVFPLNYFRILQSNTSKKSMTLHRPFKASLKSVIDIDTLQLIVRLCDSTYIGQVFKAVYTVAFFFIFEALQFVPPFHQAFFPPVSPGQGRYHFCPPGLHILIKWSKTIQDRNTVKILKHPSLGSNPICPVSAIKNLLQITPGSNNSPLFQYKLASKWLPLTDNLLARLQLQNSNLTFHAFRRSGASFNSNVSLQDIQSHGTWTSECVWKYITLDHNASDMVAKNFKNHLYVSPTP